MKRYIYDETNGLPYKLTGDYYLPRLKTPEAPQIGVWGRRRRTYLREQNKALYTAMHLAGALDTHLESIDRDATQMFDLLVKQIAEREGITEQLKAKDQMAWAGAMNTIRYWAEEAVNAEVIFV